MVVILEQEFSCRKTRIHNMVSLFFNVTGTDMKFKEAFTATKKPAVFLSYTIRNVLMKKTTKGNSYA